MILKRYAKSLHKFHRCLSRWFTISPCEPSSFKKGSPSFTSVEVWNLWNLVNVPKLHTGKLYIRQLWLGETCEGFFRTLLKFFSFFYGTKKSAEVLVKREGVFLFREGIFQKHQHVLGNCWRRISNASSTIVARNYLFGEAKIKMRIRPSVWA